MFVAAGKDSRNKAIDRVNTAATTWKGTGINSYQALEVGALPTQVFHSITLPQVSSVL